MLQLIAAPSEKEIEMFNLTEGIRSLVLFLLVVTTNAFAVEAPHKIVERELDCLTRNIHFEAGGESFESKVAVAQVSINRMHDKRYPNSLCGVIAQQTKVAERIICQFSWYCTEKKNAPISASVYNDTYEIARKVLLEGYRLLHVEDALYFHSSYVRPKWSSQKDRVARIGNLVFYSD